MQVKHEQMLKTVNLLILPAERNLAMKKYQDGFYAVK